MFKIKAADGTNNLSGRKIAQVRKSRNLSQRKLAAKMQLMGFDVDHYFIRRVENGEDGPYVILENHGLAFDHAKILALALERLG